MTTLTIALHRQMQRTLDSRRRLFVVAFLLALAAIAVLGIMSSALTQSAQTVVYGVPIIAPVEGQVCPGGEIHYPVSVSVKDNLPNQNTPAESWCKTGLSGTCSAVPPANMKDGARDMPLLKPRVIKTIATRDVPDWLAPGTYEFWHSTKDKRGVVEGYSVEPITVMDCK